jgi:hypothetical protein
MSGMKVILNVSDLVLSAYDPALQPKQLTLIAGGAAANVLRNRRIGG